MNKYIKYLIKTYGDINPNGIYSIKKEKFYAKITNIRNTNNKIKFFEMAESKRFSLVLNLVKKLNIETKKKIINAEIINELKNEFLNNEDSHIGTERLSKFYSKWDIDYKNSYKDRIKHTGKIAAIRKQIRNNNFSEYGWIISGRVMKKHLKLKYGVEIVKAHKTIDGWCYTKNLNVIGQYFENEINKYKTLQENFEHYKTILNQVQKQN